jgi:flagellar basal body rod protein FlgG
MSAISSALSGIQAAFSRLGNTANNVANLFTPGFQAGTADQSSGPDGVTVTFSESDAPGLPQASNVDPPAAIVDLISQQDSVAAGVATIRAQDEAERSVLDLLA